MDISAHIHDKFNMVGTKSGHKYFCSGMLDLHVTLESSVPTRKEDGSGKENVKPTLAFFMLKLANPSVLVSPSK